jgi:hypothetical protein
VSGRKITGDLGVEEVIPPNEIFIKGDLVPVGGSGIGGSQYGQSPRSAARSEVTVLAISARRSSDL